MKILVAVDGSVYTKRMLAYLAAHDEWLGPLHDYTIVHCTARLPDRAVGYLDRQTLKAYYGEQSERVFKPIRSFFEHQGLRATFSARLGHAGEVIASMADKGGFELIVMGSHGHGAIGSLVLGSVANRVLADCKTPVLLLR